MSEDEARRWMSTWDGPCDCGACPQTGHGLAIDVEDGVEQVSRQDEIVALASDKYKFETWISNEVGRNVVVGLAPLFDDEPFCRSFAEPLLIAGSEFIAQAKSTGGRIYVHCDRGCSRSASVVLSYMMKYEGMLLIEAVTMLKEKRVRISPNGALLDVLAKIEKSVFATHSDIDAVNAVLRRKWLPDYRAGRVRLNNVDLIM
jgi:hypothetical protein